MIERKVLIIVLQSILAVLLFNVGLNYYGDRVQNNSTISYALEDEDIQFKRVVDSFNYNIDDYDFTEEELSLIKRVRQKNEVINVPYVAGLKTPTYYNTENELKLGVYSDEDKSGFLGTQFLVAEVLTKMFDLKFDYVSYKSELELKSALERNEPHEFNGLPSMYSTGILRADSNLDYIHLYDLNIYTPQLYAFTDIKSKNYPKNFDLEEYLLYHENPIVAYVGKDTYRRSIELKIPHARFYSCISMEAAFGLNESLEVTVGCDYSPSVYDKFYEYSLTPTKPVVVIGEITTAETINSYSKMLVDYELINNIFQLPSGTVGGNKKYYEDGKIFYNHDSQLFVNMVGKIIRNNIIKFKEYRGFLYDLVNVSTVERNYRASLKKMVERPTRVGLYLDENQSDFTYQVFQKHLLVILDKIYNKYTYNGKAITYEIVIYRDTNRLLNAIFNGEIDLMGDFVYELLDRPEFKDIEYSVPTHKEKTLLVAKKNRGNVFDISSIFSQKVGYSFHYPDHIDVPESDLEHFFVMHNADRLLEYKNKILLLDAVVKGEVEYAVMDEDFLYKYQNITKQYDIEPVYEFEALSKKGFVFSSQSNSFIDDSGNSLLRPLFNSALRKMNLKQIIIENAPPSPSITDLLYQNERLVIFLQMLIVFLLVFVFAIVVFLGIGFVNTNRRLKRDAQYDYLTGCKTRRALHEDYLAFKNGSVMYIDVNDFKMVNDVHGHHAGDEVLKHITSILTKYLGKDHCYRIGGDEFVVMSPSSNLIAKIDRVMSDLASGFEFEGLQIDTKISIGFADDIFKNIDNIPRIEKTLMFLDDALYEAKNKTHDSIVRVEEESIKQYFNNKS